MVDTITKDRVETLEQIRIIEFYPLSLRDDKDFRHKALMAYECVQRNLTQTNAHEVRHVLVREKWIDVTVIGYTSYKKIVTIAKELKNEKLYLRGIEGSDGPILLLDISMNEADAI